ncbi:MAG: CBS domain-containing protein [Thiohalobacterales bacterium]|nr:CBS domain-containing protein [Thiohalobacterales bacterium]
MSNREPVRVKDVMTSHFQLVDGLMTVEDAIKLMSENGSRLLIIDKRHDNDEYGIVLLSDIARDVLSADRAPERVNVYEVMSKPAVGVDPEMDIRYCARLFQRLGFSYAPVIDQGKVLGIVGYTDLVLRGLGQ